ncbi:hypothetical protein D3C71_1597800 [compost metagenome]
MGFGAHHAGDSGAGPVQREIDGHLGQADGMAEGDQVGRALGRHDRGHPGDAEHVALLGGAVAHQREGVRQHGDGAGGHRHAMGAGLVADIDHMGLSGGVEVGELAHGVRIRGIK